MPSSTPSPAALEQAATLAGPAATIDQVRPLAGGTHASTFLIRTADPVLEVVLREYPPGDDAAGREAHALEVLDGLKGLDDLDGLAPRLLLGDPTATWSERPSVLISRLPGAADIHPGDPAGWAGQLGSVLARLHGVGGQRVAGLPPVFSRPGGSALVLTGPAAASVEARWSQLQRSTAVLTHYDYWSGNVLWDSGRLSGIVDWNGASLGPPEFDVGWCRLDLVLLFDRVVADAFLQSYRRANGPAVNAELADLWAVARSHRDVETWMPNYRDLGRADLTAAELRRRHDAWTDDLLPTLTAQVHIDDAPPAHH